MGKERQNSTYRTGPYEHFPFLHIVAGVDTIDE